MTYYEKLEKRKEECLNVYDDKVHPDIDKLRQFEYDITVGMNMVSDEITELQKRMSYLVGYHKQISGFIYRTEKGEYD